MTSTERPLVLDVALVERIASSISCVDPDDKEWLLENARRHPNKLAPTLLSVWKAAGVEIGELLERELELHHSRIDAYRDLEKELQRSYGAAFYKGTTVSDLYPAGILRQTNDVDAVIGDGDALWSAAAELHSKGWSPESLLVLKLRAELRFLVVLTRSNGEPLVLGGDRVELSSFAAWGDFFGLAALEASVLPRPSSPAAALICLLAEGVERRFAGRDVLDALVLIDALGTDHGPLRRLIRQAGLEPEAQRLFGVVEQAIGVKLASGFGHGALSAIRLRRSLAGLCRQPNPKLAMVGRLQRKKMKRRTDVITRLSDRYVVPRVDAATALEAGLPLFGLRVGSATQAGIAIKAHARVCLATTPIGQYVLVPSDSVPAGDIPVGVEGAH